MKRIDNIVSIRVGLAGGVTVQEGAIAAFLAGLELGLTSISFNHNGRLYAVELQVKELTELK